MKILYLTTVLPRRRSGGEIASEAFIAGLQACGCHVTVLGFRRKGGGALPAHQIAVGERPIETRSAPVRAGLWLAEAVMNGVPYSVQKFHSRRYLGEVRRQLSRHRFDAVIIEHSQLAWLEPLLVLSCPLVFNVQNVEHEVYLEQAERASGIRKAILMREGKLMRSAEERVAAAADQVWTLTGHDAAYFWKAAGAGRVKVFGVPSVHGAGGGGERVKRFDVGLVGTWSWEPNREGLEWFLARVYPHLNPEVTVRVAGSGGEWLRGRFRNVSYCGFVPSLGDFVAEARVIAIPAVSGGGIQIKTLDAIATGGEIAATPFALRGIADPPGSVHLFDTPEAFADGIHRLLLEPPSPERAARAAAWASARRGRFIADLHTAVGELVSKGAPAGAPVRGEAPLLHADA